MKSYVFGPVPSRRLGRSLGVDLVPFKTCTYDCIYCQLGRTTCKTVERKEWVPLDDVLQQVREKLSSHPDYITLSGSGEPTLFSRAGELIAAVKAMTDVPVAVLTNGSLLWLPEVADALREADLVIPSLDAGDPQLFQYVNRPHKDLSFDQMAEGLIEFRRHYAGQYWLEVFLLGGASAVPAEVAKIGKIVRRINPDRVQVNTVTRPPAEEFALQVSREQLERFIGSFGNKAEVIADYQGTHQKTEFAAQRQNVLELLDRRPCTTDDIAEGLGLHHNEVVKYIEELSAEGKIRSELHDRRLYYSRA